MHTMPNVSPGGHNSWNSSNKMAACGTCSGLRVELRNAFPRSSPCKMPLSAFHHTRDWQHWSLPRFGAVLAPESDWLSSFPVADNEVGAVPLANRDLVDPNFLRGRSVRSMQLLEHVLLVGCLDRVTVQPGFLGDILARHGPVAPSKEEGEALDVERMVRQPIQGFLLHLSRTSCTRARRDKSPPPGSHACPRMAGHAPSPSYGHTRTERPVRTRRMQDCSSPA